jgi:aspartate carbamoyltransferase catalytic subunit
LLDAVTLQQVFGDVAGLSLAIVGDIRHSRVARSDVELFTRLGMTDIRLAGPPAMLPEDAGGLRCCGSVDEAVAGANVVMMLRIQRERLGDAEQPDGERWFSDWGLTSQRLARAAADCVIMHPGPVNRGVEIESELVDGSQSLITKQVANGVYTRMAVLLCLLEGEAAALPG